MTLQILQFNVLRKTSMTQVKNALLVGSEGLQNVINCTEAHQLKTRKQQGILCFVNVYFYKAIGKYSFLSYVFAGCAMNMDQTSYKSIALVQTIM